MLSNASVAGLSPATSSLGVARLGHRWYGVGEEHLSLATLWPQTRTTNALSVCCEALPIPTGSLDLDPSEPVTAPRGRDRLPGGCSSSPALPRFASHPFGELQWTSGVFTTLTWFKLSYPE